MNTMAVGALPDEPIRWITNSKGFRNQEEFSYEVPQGTYRVLLIGDSHVDGLRIDQNKTVGYQLDAILERSIASDQVKEVQVLNAGENNPVDYWYYYQQHGWKYHPGVNAFPQWCPRFSA